MSVRFGVELKQALLRRLDDDDPIHQSGYLIGGVDELSSSLLVLSSASSNALPRDLLAQTPVGDALRIVGIFARENCTASALSALKQSLQADSATVASNRCVCVCLCVSSSRR